jgi:N-acetylmuramoyl-L-alanine amidase
MRLSRQICLRPVFKVLILALVSQLAAAADLEIWVDGRRESVNSRTREGDSYFRVRDLAEIFDLTLQESDSTLTISGVRGVSQLTRDRLLVRLGDQFILLSDAVWRRREGDWYVPEDFLVNALPNLLTYRLVKQEDGSFRAEGLARIGVEVQMVMYPDHLSVLFSTSRWAPATVREFRDYVEVGFEDFLAAARSLERSPDPMLVSEVSFVPQEGLGVFRIRKGSRFGDFRHYQLEEPPRLVIDIYGRVQERSLAQALPLEPRKKPTREIPSRDREEASASFRQAARQPVIMIDPGHGGQDYGVDSGEELLEKGITISLARRIQHQLRQAGHRVRLSRLRDVELRSEQRSAVANFYQSQLYVGIHAGGSAENVSRGPVLYIYQPPEIEGANRAVGQNRKTSSEALVPWEQGQIPFLKRSRELAELLQQGLNPLFGVDNRVVRARLAVLAPIRAPAVIIETGFLTNLEDRELLKNSEFEEQLATTVSQAIASFLR